jgi:TPR repeat protein
MAMFRSLAQSGSAQAQLRLAQMYERGEGVLQNFVEAVRRFCNAAAQSSLPAITRLGEICLTGLSAPQTATPAALPDLERDDDPDSLLKQLYPEGLAVRADPEQAALWNSIAAQAGDPVAQARLGHQYATGMRLPRDLEAAERWFTEAARQEHSTGQLGLGMLYAGGYGDIREHVRALGWFELSAAAGQPTAQLSLAMLLLSGEGIQHDAARAAGLLQTAADAGHPAAMFHLIGWEPCMHRELACRRIPTRQPVGSRRQRPKTTATRCFIWAHCSWAGSVCPGRRIPQRRALRHRTDNRGAHTNSSRPRPEFRCFCRNGWWCRVRERLAFMRVDFPPRAVRITGDRATVAQRSDRTDPSLAVGCFSQAPEPVAEHPCVGVQDDSVVCWIQGEAAIDGLHEPAIVGIAQQFDPPRGRKVVQRGRQKRIVRRIIHDYNAGVAAVLRWGMGSGKRRPRWNRARSRRADPAQRDTRCLERLLLARFGEPSSSRSPAL